MVGEVSAAAPGLCDCCWLLAAPGQVSFPAALEVAALVAPDGENQADKSINQAAVDAVDWTTAPRTAQFPARAHVVHN